MTPPRPIPPSTLRALADLAEGAQQALRRCEIERAMELLGIMRVMLALHGTETECPMCDATGPHIVIGDEEVPDHRWSA